MDDQKLLPPLARGDSKRANLDKLSILDLPAELRNQIYEYFVKYPAPIRTDFKEHPKSDPVFLIDPQVRIPVNLFASCRTIYREAMSAFYSDNTFSLAKKAPDDYWSLHDSCTILVPHAFFTRLGSQAYWLKKVVLDIDLADGTSFYRGFGRWDMTSGGGYLQYDITPLLRAIWSRDLNIAITLINSKNVAPNDPLGGMDCNAKAITAILRSILGGQLDLRKYGQLLYGIGINLDGSGGKVLWSTTNPCYVNEWSVERFSSDSHFTSSFIAEESGSRLEMNEREKPLALLDFPQHLLKRIMDMVVHPAEGFRIDLDKDTKFDCGLIRVSHATHGSWRNQFLFDRNNFELILTTNRKRTDFDEFKKLRKFLRKTFDPISDYDRSVKTLVAGDGSGIGCDNRMKYTLKFEVEDAVSLNDIRINALPLVMETSTSHKDTNLTVQVWTKDANGSTTMTASHTLALRELRLNIVTVLMKSYYLEKKQLTPDCWINGLGQVVEVEDVDNADGEAWVAASDLNPSSQSGLSHVRNLHLIDSAYRKGACHPECVIEDVLFFPFRREAKEIIAYLTKSIDGRFGGDSPFA